MSSLYATEKLPQPSAVESVVDTDVLTRTLGVRLSEREVGYSKLLWREAFQQLRAAAENGWRNHPFVYASTPDNYQVAHAAPGEFQTLKVHFPVGVAGYATLIGQPGLVAIVTIDRSTRRFLAVKFLNRP